MVREPVGGDAGQACHTRTSCFAVVPGLSEQGTEPGPELGVECVDIGVVDFGGELVGEVEQRRHQWREHVAAR